MSRRQNAPAREGFARRSGLITGMSEQFNRYKVLKRQERRSISVAQRARRFESGGSSSNSDASLDLDPDLEITKCVGEVKKLSNELYLPLREKHPVNLVYSPLGFSISSLMLKLGAKGKTREEFSQAFKTITEGTGRGDEEDDAEMITGLGALLSELNLISSQKKTPFILRQANKIYLDKEEHGGKIKLSYRNKVTAIYNGVHLEEISFGGEADWARTSGVINKWSHTVSGNKLGEILTRRTVNNKIILINPIYFKGEWLYSFNKELTSEGRFFTDEKNFVSVPMMRTGPVRNLLYFTVNKLSCKGIVLPFKGDRLCLVIFLPLDKAGLPGVETGLENIKPEEYFRSGNEFRKKLGRNQGFDVVLPRFKIDCTIDFEGTMKEFGIERAFQEDKADFSKMLENTKKTPKGGNGYYVTQILQKVMLCVDEGGAPVPQQRSVETFRDRKDRGEREGTVIGTEDGDNEIETTEFRVDHPFYFQLVDMKSDLILLSGSCKNPLHGKDFGFREFLEKYDIPLGEEKNEGKGAFIKSHGQLK